MKTNFLSSRWGRFASVITTLILLGQGAAFAQPAAPVGGEANLQLPDLTQVQFLGMNGHQPADVRSRILHSGNDLRPGHVLSSEGNAGA